MNKEKENLLNECGLVEGNMCWKCSQFVFPIGCGILHILGLYDEEKEEDKK